MKRVQGLLLVLVIGCAGQKQTPTQSANYTAVQATVDAGGGELTHPTGTKLTVPAGALPGSLELSITGADTATEVPNGVGQAFVLGPEGTQFSQPVTLTVPYSPDQLHGVDEKTLAIYIAPADTRV